MSARDRALDELTSEFPMLSAKVVVAIFLRYIDSTDSLADAVAATRERILDACAVC